MKFIKVPIPNDGYCAFYAFSVGMINLIKFSHYKPTKEIIELLNAEINKEKNKYSCIEMFRSSSFVHDTFQISTEQYLNDYFTFNRIVEIHDLLKSADCLEKYYALAILLGTVLSKTHKSNKCEVFDLNRLAYQFNVNLNILILNDHVRHYENNTNKETVINISWMDGHFESLIPLESPLSKLFTVQNIKCEPSSLDQVQQFDASYYNYWTKAKSIASKNRNLLLFSGAIILGCAVRKMLSDESTSDTPVKLKF